ncbi:MAG: twitching motility protein PilT [Sphingomonas bacterium]|uniref:type II toxin-antitoxin system VapC family toxin n=1 Tax=Sphingomonas bacterium TaxID=1895847 RepID=UPI00261A3870|nr:type II toxin-antitoxin system VapC family toxin [Sphingomonas bacterium]MDB5709879.1 twitching motility protein PilT [Sphingomonas bacterium]
MSFLLDTHALIWWWLDSTKLPTATRALLADRTNDVSVSAAAGWEIATKVNKGKLPEMTAYVGDYASLVVRAGFRHLDIRHDHGLHAGLLPGAHGDPFDRMMAAQALIENLTVVTRDPAFANFGCSVQW